MSFKYKPKGETENKTIRFPRDVIDQIEAVLQGKENASFSSFVIQACEYALNDMEGEEKETKDTNHAEED